MTPAATFPDNGAIFAAMLAYALASLLYVAGKSRFFRAAGRAAVVAGAVLLAVSAQDQLISTGNWGASAGPLLAAMIGAGALAADRWLGVRLVPALLVPLGMLILLVRFFAAPAPHIHPSPWLTGFHVTMALAGQAMAITACVLSALYLWQHRALKQRRILELASRVPSLERLDECLRFALVTGFITLNLSLITGALFMTALPPGISAGMLLALRAKILWAISVWSWYLATLVARNILRSPVRIVARMSVGGFVLMSLAWFGLIFLANRPNLTIPLAG